MKRWRRWLGIAVLVALACVGLAPFSAPGTRVLIALASRFPPLQIEYASGALFGSLELAAVSYSDAAVTLRLRNLQSTLRPGCLLAGGLCFERLAIGQLDTQLAADREPAKEPALPSGRITLDEVTLGQLHVRWAGGDFAARDVELSGLAYAPAAFAVAALRARQPTLALATEPASSAPWQPFSFRAPLAIDLSAVQLERPALHLGDVTYLARQIDVSASMEDSALRIASLSMVEENLGDLQLDGEIAFTGNWPLALRFIGRPAPALFTRLQLPVHATAPVSGRVSGDALRQDVQLAASLRSDRFDDAIGLDLRAGLEGGQVTLQKLALQRPGELGMLSASGTVTLGQDLRAGLRLQAAAFNPPPAIGSAVRNLAGSMTLQVSAAGDALALSASGVALSAIVAEMPVTLAGAVDWHSATRLPWGQLRGLLNGAPWTYQRAREEAAVVTLTSEKATTWPRASTASLDLRGTLAATADSGAVAGSVRGLAEGNLAVEELTLDLEAAWQQRLSLNGSLRADGADIAGQHFPELVAGVTGTADRQSATLDLAGPVSGQLAVENTREQSRHTLRIAPTVLQTTLGDIRLNENLQVTYDSNAQRLAFPQHCWQVVGAALCLDAGEIGSQGEIAGALDGVMEIPASLVRGVAALRGAVNGRVHARWSPRLPLAVDLAFDLADSVISFPQALEAAGPLALDAMAVRYTLDGAQAQGHIAVNSADLGAVVLDFTGAAAAPDAGALEITNLQLPYFLPFLPGLDGLAGTADGKVAIARSEERPQLDGSITLRDGLVKMRNSDAALTALAASIGTSGEVLTIDGEGVLGGGPLDFTGSLNVYDRAGEVYLTGTRNVIHLPQRVDAVFSPDLTLAFAAGEGSVRGSITVHEGQFRHRVIPDGGVALSPDVVLVDAASRDEKKGLGFLSAADIEILVEDRFRILASQLDATVGGKLHLLDEKGKPVQVFGDVGIIGGELRIFGQQLQLKEGNMGFVGATDNPELNLRAEREIKSEQLRVGFTVRGTLSEPLFDLYSEPPMSQRDTLSYLLRGRGPDVGASVDGTALALSLGASAVNQSGVVGSLNALPLISNISFGTDGTDRDMAATVSGYVGERIFVSYGLGLYEPVYALTARLYLQARLWVEVVSRLENSVDLYYRFDIQ